MSHKATPVILDQATGNVLNNIAKDNNCTDEWKAIRAKVVLKLANGDEVKTSA